MKHGTNHAYDQGCRCEECKAFKSAKSRARRERLKRLAAEAPEAVPHGTANGYNKFGCRCPECTAAFRDARTQWRDAQREASRRAYSENPVSRRELRKKEQALERATRHGQQWAGSDLEMLVARDDLSDAELAERLGRSIDAVRAARHKALHHPKWMKATGVDDA